jgi:hypothetical protein
MAPGPILSPDLALTANPIQMQTFKLTEIFVVSKPVNFAREFLTENGTFSPLLKDARPFMFYPDAGQAISELPQDYYQIENILMP